MTYNGGRISRSKYYFLNVFVSENQANTHWPDGQDKYQSTPQTVIISTISMKVDQMVKIGLLLSTRKALKSENEEKGHLKLCLLKK